MTEEDEGSWIPFSGGFQDDLEKVDDEKKPGREQCQECERPARVCWCSFLPTPPLKIRSRVVIFQHPNEVKRGIRTALMAARGIADDRCQIIQGRKFPGQNSELKTLMENPNSVVLYPGKDATPVPDLDPNRSPWTFIVLDGTWDEARKLFARNPLLQKMPRVSLDLKDKKSAYVVRTQPADFCLSTLETVAETLSIVESDPGLVEALVRPLHAMCNIQIQHGAVNHDSKEIKEQNSNFVKKSNFKKKKNLVCSKEDQ